MKILKETHAGPDDPIYTGGLRVSSVPGPSELTKNSQKSTAGVSYKDPLKYQLWNEMIRENIVAAQDGKKIPWPGAPASGADIAALWNGPLLAETPLLSVLELARRETKNPDLTATEYLLST